jgi:hypothetical protein
MYTFIAYKAGSLILPNSCESEFVFKNQLDDKHLISHWANTLQYNSARQPGEIEYRVIVLEDGTCVYDSEAALPFTTDTKQADEDTPEGDLIREQWRIARVLHARKIAALLATSTEYAQGRNEANRVVQAARDHQDGLDRDTQQEKFDRNEMDRLHQKYPNG